MAIDAVRRRPNFQSCLLILIALMAAFGIAEISYRLVTAVRKPLYRPSSLPGLGWEFTPGAVKKAPVSESGTLVYRINSLGFRDKTEKAWTAWQKGDLKIAFLGDSVTFGPEVDDEKTFSALFEQMAAPLAGRPVRVLNAGVEATNTLQHASLFENKLLKLNPDMVVLDYFPNDIEKRSVEDMPPVLSFALRHSHFLTFLSNRVMTWIKNNRARRAGDAYFGISQPDGKCLSYNDGMLRRHTDESAWGRQEELLSKMARLAKEKNVLFAIAYFPFEEEVRGGCPDFARKRIAAFAAAQNIPFIDMAAAFLEHGDRRLYIKSDDIHLSSAGHRAAAEAFLQWFSKSKFLRS